MASEHHAFLVARNASFAATVTIVFNNYDLTGPTGRYFDAK